jgi:hypothetical protein
MSKIEIEITDNNRFNEGWLAYLLGMDRPDPEEHREAADGWDMGEDTRDLRPIRAVFLPRPIVDEVNRPAFIVRPLISEPVVTNVGPDQQDEAKAIAKRHAAKVAGVSDE